MGFWNTLKDVGSAAFAPVTGGLSLVGMDEDTMARVPLLGPLTGSQTDAQKQLLKKQEQMAEETRKRMRVNQQARMQALGQQMLAFNPMNQTMAKMFGPDAAFKPEQLAAMAADPMKPQLDPSLYGYQGTDPKKVAEMNAFMADKKAYDENEKRRRDMLMQNLSPLPQGPAPIAMPKAQPGRRY